MKKSNDKIKRSAKISKLSIVLYVVAVILAIYSLVTMYSSYTYISSLIDTGSIVVSDQLLDIIQYFMGESMPYVFYAIAIWAMGYIINILDNLKKLNISKNSDFDAKIN